MTEQLGLLMPPQEGESLYRLPYRGEQPGNWKG
jgi:hypothetical protein